MAMFGLAMKKIVEFILRQEGIEVCKRGV